MSHVPRPLSRSVPRTVIAVATCASVAAAGLVAAAPAAYAASPNVVIAEVYGGGGNSGAPLDSDFVELFNRGASPVDLTGWKVAYWSAAGTTASTTTLAGSLPVGGRYLVKEATGANTAAPDLPTPDATGTITMSATAGRVAVLDASGATVDLVGYGSASVFEGTGPAPAPSNTTSVARIDACVDGDQNGTEFAAGAPSPANSSSPTQTCDVAPPPNPVETISQIQGMAHRSTLAGTPVNGVAGIVTARSNSGFWMQDPVGDGDLATSEGILVFTRTAPTVTVGDAVTVDGSATEFRPGGTGGSDNLTTTEIVSPVVTIASSGNPLPAPVVIGVDRIAPPQTIDVGNPGSVENASAVVDITRDAIDFYESMEGMRVAVRDARVVGPTASFGEIPVIPGQTASAPWSSAGGVVYGSYTSPNAMRVQLDDALIPAGSMPAADVGDTLPGDTVGVLDYSFANFKLLVTAPPSVTAGGLARESTTPQSNNQLAVATFNVENLSPSNPQVKFDRLAAQVVTNLAAPDILALEEIQDNSGPADDGVVASDLTVSRFVAAIAAAGGPAYGARWIDPQNKTDGGQPGGNIRQVFLYRLDRDLQFVDRPGGDATTAVEVTGSGRSTALSISPGRIAPTSEAWSDSRKPLAGEFRFRGETVFVVAVHFSSKGGDDPLFGRWQEPVRFTEAQRHLQAAAVRDFADTLLAADPKARLVVAGDVNDFEFSTTADLLVGSGSTALIDLPRTVTPAERWTYVFEGNSQVLDHILISPALAVAPKGAKYPAYVYDIVHTNAPFHDQDSDHDPQVVRLAIRGGTGI
ncbi:MAG: lamin tail domain-containing protein [Actinomycetales bacterium]|nr:lamin tail domain-containing protein [Candidatus Phosphoribacter baldrii]